MQVAAVAVTDPDLIRLFATRLEAISIPYMITGGVATVIFGDPRFTRDIDIVLELRPADAGRLTSVFSGGDYQLPPLEALRRERERARGGHFKLVHRDTGLRADVYVRGEDPLHDWAFERRLRLPVEETRIWVAPVEYVILRKLRCFRTSGSEQHLRDIAMMLRIGGDSIDASELAGWVQRLELREALEAARRYAG